MQLTKTFFPNSAIFIEKKWVENRLWEKVHFCGEKNVSSPPLGRLGYLCGASNPIHHAQAASHPVLEAPGAGVTRRKDAGYGRLLPPVPKSAGHNRRPFNISNDSESLIEYPGADTSFCQT